MARITVEDCLENVENRFELVTLAAKRAHQLAALAARRAYPIAPHQLAYDKAKVDLENDKPTVLALREIAEGLTTREDVENPDILPTIDMDPAQLRRSVQFASVRPLPSESD